MPSNELSTQEAAELLRVSKGTIYELIRRGDLQSYKVGRKVRFSKDDVQAYINHSKDAYRKRRSDADALDADGTIARRIGKSDVVICGQDLILDVLSNYLRMHSVQALRAYIGSYDGLVSLYRRKVSVSAAHLWDGETDSYNIPYVRRLLPGIPALVVHLVSRMQGFYVLQGNPKNIREWDDLKRPELRLRNREPGAGSRVLVDENLRIRGIAAGSIVGYDDISTSHLAVASAVGRGEADVAVGIEKIARQVDNIEFIPLKKEQYDLVFRKDDLSVSEVALMLDIIRSSPFRQEFANIGGYDTSNMGKVVAEL